MREHALGLFDANRSLSRFILGTAAMTGITSVIYDTIQSRFGIPGVWVWAAFLIVVVALVVAYPALRRRFGPRLTLNDAALPSPRAGLILLVSQQTVTPKAAIDYHVPALRVLWLVASEQTLGVARQLRSDYEDKVPDIRLGDAYVVDGDSAASTYAVVSRILEVEAPAKDLGAKDIIADITGGLKPMTAGMALACFALNRDAQYMRSRRNPSDGKPLGDGLLEPIRLDLSIERGARDSDDVLDVD